jgi:hypothetical protein
MYLRWTPFFLETPSGNAAYGESGISHSPASAHLVICALPNAIGKWIDPPATPDKVLVALGNGPALPGGLQQPSPFLQKLL